MAGDVVFALPGSRLGSVDARFCCAIEWEALDGD
jgi:hypothetical protein